MLIVAVLAAILPIFAPPTHGSRIKHLIGVDRAGSFREIQQSEKDTHTEVESIGQETEALATHRNSYTPRIVAAAEFSSVATADVAFGAAADAKKAQTDIKKLGSDVEANEVFGQLFEGLAVNSTARRVRVTIENVEFSEYLYSSDLSLDADRRFVLTRPVIRDGPARDVEGQWEIEKVKGNTVLIKNVKHNEYMYANRPMIAPNGTVVFNETERRQVLTWKPGGFSEEEWLEGQWVLKHVKGDVWSIENKAHNEYMYSSEYKLIADGIEGRAVLTWVPEGFDPADDTGRWAGTARWRIRTLSLADAMASDKEASKKDVSRVPTLPPDVLGDLPKARALQTTQVEGVKPDVL